MKKDPKSIPNPDYQTPKKNSVQGIMYEDGWSKLVHRKGSLQLEPFPKKSDTLNHIGNNYGIL